MARVGIGTLMATAMASMITASPASAADVPSPMCYGGDIIGYNPCDLAGVLSVLGKADEKSVVELNWDSPAAIDMTFPTDVDASTPATNPDEPVSVAITSSQVLDATAPDGTLLAHYEAQGGGQWVPASSPAAAVRAAGGGASYPCIYSSPNRDFQRLGVFVDYLNMPSVSKRYNTNFYMQNRAGQVPDYGTVKRLEACSLGGFDFNKGFRQTESGITVSVNRNTPRTLIGTTGATGTNTPNVSSSLTIGASLGPVTVSGSTSQNATGSNGYSDLYGPRYSAPERFPATRAYAWWKSTDRYTRAAGSSDRQSTSLNMLWEFPQKERNLVILHQTVSTAHCANFFNSCYS